MEIVNKLLVILNHEEGFDGYEIEHETEDYYSFRDTRNKRYLKISKRDKEFINLILKRYDQVTNNINDMKKQMVFYPVSGDGSMPTQDTNVTFTTTGLNGIVTYHQGMYKPRDSFDRKDVFVRNDGSMYGAENVDHYHILDSKDQYSEDVRNNRKRDGIL